jgi:hypothetical protein
MEMYDCVGIAVARFLVYDVDRLSVQVIGQYFGEGDTWTINFELNETWRQRRGCSHRISTKTPKRILVHGDKRPPSTPSRIALGMN